MASRNLRHPEEPAERASRRTRRLPPNAVHCGHDASAMNDDLAARTDSYFLKTKAIVERFGDRAATYAVFMRRPVLCAPSFAIDFLERVAAERGTSFEIELNHPEAD